MRGSVPAQGPIAWLVPKQSACFLLNAPRNSVFVRDLRPDEQERYNARMRRNEQRLTISNKVITEAEFIVQPANEVALKNKFGFLCEVAAFSAMTYGGIVTSLRNMESSDAKLLSSIPPLFSTSRPPIFFLINLVFGTELVGFI